MPESLCQRSDLGLTGQHVLIVGSSGAAGSEIVRKFLGMYGVLCEMPHHLHHGIIIESST